MKAKKILTMALCAVLLVCISVGATVAYLTSQTEEVKNTFTVGQVKITLDEGDVYEDGETGATAENLGKHKDNGVTRVQENKYKLLPGFPYDKDPTIHIDKASEEAYLRVKVAVTNTAKVDALFQAQGYAEAGITAILAGFNADLWNITSTVDTANDTRNYVLEYKEKISGTTADIELFTNVVVPTTFNNDEIIELNGTQIKIIAEAIQADGFSGSAAAWTAFDSQN